MLRWLVRKLLFCCLIFALFCYLNQTRPNWLERLGSWVGGEVGNRVSVAVSEMFDTIKEGSGIRDAVEVFREGVQN